MPIPVLCIGNAIVGGSGKTPVALALGAMLEARGVRAHYLSRGYKGRLKGPVRVDPSTHGAGDVGDEPLLLAARLPAWIARNRPDGAKAALEAGAELILMDDGFQNPSLHKDASLLVIDGSYGFGNGLLLPAGPLREKVADAMVRATAVMLIGDDRHGALAQVPAGLPVFRARMRALPDAQKLKSVPVLAFAGIARPRKFHRTLQELGAEVRRMVAFPDHHAFTAKDLDFLRKAARELGARLVTTSKDYVRLPLSMRAEVTCVEVEAVIEDGDALLAALLAPAGSGLVDKHAVQPLHPSDGA